MNTTERYFYKKADKLKSRKAIDLLFKSGNTFSSFPFKVMWLPQNSAVTLQAGVGVSSRQFKKAVDRNRIKRLMREAYRMQKNKLSELLSSQDKRLSVFIIYTGRQLPEYAFVFEKTGVILNRLIKLMDEQA